MRTSFDRRVVPEPALQFIRACQRRVPCHLGGGAALAGAFLAHRLSRDLDRFCHEAALVRELVRELPAVAAEASVGVTIQRDSGMFVRVDLDLGGSSMAADLVHEAVADIEPPPPPIESVVVESLADLRASKITASCRESSRAIWSICYFSNARGSRSNAISSLRCVRTAESIPASWRGCCATSPSSRFR